MRMVVTGRHGQVVTALTELARDCDSITVVPLGRPALDLANLGAIDQALIGEKPDIIISAGAYTAVDKAESDDQLAMTVNGRAPAVIADTAARLDIPLIHLSTDYVFDGTGVTAYGEDDPVNPVSVYGRTKRAGEEAVMAAGCDHAIVRTSWVYSPFGSNFVKTMLRLATERDMVAVVADQKGAPTSALDIAHGLFTMADQMLTYRTDPGRRGIFHLTGATSTDWATFAEGIFAASAAWGGPSAAVRRITAADYPTAARRPANSRLDNGKLLTHFGISPPSWTQSIIPVVERLLKADIG
ncbi:dTDP-4-dehydrorhamnose reductase [Sphingobium sp. CR2-8]|uniref:dTDP-4-dehydrorhamnose reductase n=1 Tax=Sphingobium sp. CR2-8 TaxID=1306534 RepID=UPI002DBB21B5|nr:dTDP-4-dehydrorhamnose reductase [Sphingobium sp. CR2-8]MEC3912786.1 dTDP-4-dehydrorhamnose reductase [Sphingobium sp. CR2-8]